METRLPLLADKLTLPQRVMLGSMTRHVGFPVLVMLIEAMCDRSTEEVVKLDPEKDIQNYEKLLSVRQQASRTTHRNSKDILDSIEYHRIRAGQEVPADLDNQLQLGGE